MNKVIFITGATKNTGLAIAEKFAKNGYDVALTSRRADDAEKTAVDLSRKYGTKAKGMLLIFRASRISRTFSQRCAAISDGLTSSSATAQA